MKCKLPTSPFPSLQPPPHLTFSAATATSTPHLLRRYSHLHTSPSPPLQPPLHLTFSAAKATSTPHLFRRYSHLHTSPFPPLQPPPHLTFSAATATSTPHLLRRYSHLYNSLVAPGVITETREEGADYEVVDFLLVPVERGSVFGGVDGGMRFVCLATGAGVRSSLQYATSELYVRLGK